MRSQENPDIFEKKACHGFLAATKALLRSSHGVLSRSYGVLTGDYMHSHGAHNACTALSRRSHCADGVLKTFVCTTQRSLRQFYVCSRK